MSWHVGIIWGEYWFSKTGGLRIDHGSQAHKWSWNIRQDKTSVLLRPGTSKLACEVFCGLYRFAKTGRLRSDPGGQAHKWSWNRGQDKMSMLLRAGTSKLACEDLLVSLMICQNWRTQKWPWRPGNNKTIVLSWPLIQDHLWTWSLWMVTSESSSFGK